MKYYLFDTNNECLSEVWDVKTALQTFGTIYDAAGDERENYRVEIYLDLNNGKEKYFNTFYLPAFLNTEYDGFEKADRVHDASIIDRDGDGKPILMNEEEIEAFNAGDKKAFEEAAANFSEEQLQAVLKYIPTGFIVAEIARRFNEYDKATNEIQHTLNNMKIYQTDDRKDN